MKLMTGYEFIEVPAEFDLCPHCKQTRLMRVGARLVCGKDGSKHDRGIRYSRVVEEGPGGSLTMPMSERIRGRQVSIEIGEVPGVGWVAIGIVAEGLSHEKGMRFEARGEDPTEAEQGLKMEIEAAFV
jgi:hypothetical protein